MRAILLILLAASLTFSRLPLATGVVTEAADCCCATQDVCCCHDASADGSAERSSGPVWTGSCGGGSGQAGWMLLPELPRIASARPALLVSPPRLVSSLRQEAERTPRGTRPAPRPQPPRAA